MVSWFAKRIIKDNVLEAEHHSATGRKSSRHRRRSSRMNRELLTELQCTTAVYTRQEWRWAAQEEYRDAS